MFSLHVYTRTKLMTFRTSVLLNILYTTEREFKLKITKISQQREILQQQQLIKQMKNDLEMIERWFD